MSKWMILLVGLFSIATAQAASFDEGVHYHWVAPERAAGDKIEVIEFFWYGCPHCFSFEPFIDTWQQTMPDDVEFVKLPATFNRPEVQMHAKVFFALELMGAPSAIHADIMHEMHDNHNRLATQGEMENFLAGKGVDIEALRSAMDSFAVAVKVKRAAQLAERYGISGVPSLVVDGQYRNGNVKSYEEMIELLDYLVDTARENRAAG